MAKATTPVQSVRDLILFDETRYTLWDAAIENFAQQHASSNYVEIPVSDLTPQWFNEAKLSIPDEKYFHEFEINRILFLPAW